MSIRKMRLHQSDGAVCPDRQTDKTALKHARHVRWTVSRPMWLHASGSSTVSTRKERCLAQEKQATCEVALQGAVHRRHALLRVYSLRHGEQDGSSAS